MLCPRGNPPVFGGAERLWEGVVDHMCRVEGVVAELVLIDSPEASAVEVIRSYQTFSDLNLDHFDMVISGKYPAWMVRHRNHVVYMCHPLRGLYDTYPGHLSKVATPQSEVGLALETTWH
jgi:hypothetical protein